ncbi:Acetylcholinesterase/Butyrylcholinesterase [Ceraceosorus bombacis]|uniref:Carboxylic ester hydrolase n=1 Tax=Ceraceosorus bombacis TaxID=401625 RepID=A0A0N7LB42_9BASI|nr:Acetylcholinesterase/Butyrylcholinesterase [Ceraceosorus bombacis]
MRFSLLAPLAALLATVACAPSTVEDAHHNELAARTADAAAVEAHAALEGRAVDYRLVKTTSGQVRGVDDGNGVYRWLGVRYGADTSGAKRFTKSTLAPSADGVFDASNAGPSCPSVQSASSYAKLAFTGQQIDPPSKWSEDCLRVNIWAKQSTRRGAKARLAANGKGGAAVLFWVYGGSFNTGTATIPLYRGNNFAANEDVIVVSFAYRHSIFGNPLSDYVTKQKENAADGWNFGLLDMELALEWVQKNIARFGGDPSKITLFGGSSGSTMIDAYSYAHVDKPAVASSLIVSSGSVIGLQLASGTKSIFNFARYDSEWNTVSDSLGCGRSGGQTQFQCMQKVPMMDLVNATVKLITSDNTVQFGPTPDGHTWFQDYALRSNTGRVSKIPTMIGTNSNEATLFSDDPGNTLIVKISDAAFTPPLWTCPAMTNAADRARVGAPTWRYQYHGAWEDFTQGYPALGSYHFAECPMLFGTYPPYYLGNPSKKATITPEQDKTSRLMQHAWAEFARDPVNGLPKLGWPQYNPTQKTLANIALNNQPQLTLTQTNFIDQGGCAVTVPSFNFLQGLRQTIVSLW